MSRVIARFFVLLGTWWWWWQKTTRNLLFLLLRGLPRESHNFTRLPELCINSSTCGASWDYPGILTRLLRGLPRDSHNFKRLPVSFILIPVHGGPHETTQGSSQDYLGGFMVTICRLYGRFTSYYGQSCKTLESFKYFNLGPLRKPSNTTFYLGLHTGVPVVFQCDCERGGTTWFSSLNFFRTFETTFIFFRG